MGGLAVHGFMGQKLRLFDIDISAGQLGPLESGFFPLYACSQVELALQILVGDSGYGKW